MLIGKEKKSQGEEKSTGWFMKSLKPIMDGEAERMLITKSLICSLMAGEPCQYVAQLLATMMEARL